MERMMVKSEENIGKRYLCMVDSEVQSVRGLKRRRREPAAVTVRTEDQSQSLQQQTNQTSPATTVKRSSRFRGVSRSTKTFCFCHV